MLYREEAGDGVVFELSIVSWDSVVTDGFSVLNIDVAETVTVSSVEISDMSPPEPSSAVKRMELASCAIEVCSLGTVS